MGSKREPAARCGAVVPGRGAEACAGAGAADATGAVVKASVSTTEAVAATSRAARLSGEARDAESASQVADFEGQGSPDPNESLY